MINDQNDSFRNMPETCGQRSIAQWENKAFKPNLNFTGRKENKIAEFGLRKDTHEKQLKVASSKCLIGQAGNLNHAKGRCDSVAYAAAHCEKTTTKDEKKLKAKSCYKQLQISNDELRKANHGKQQVVSLKCLKTISNCETLIIKKSKKPLKAKSYEILGKWKNWIL